MKRNSGKQALHNGNTTQKLIISKQLTQQTKYKRETLFYTEHIKTEGELKWQ